MHVADRAIVGLGWRRGDMGAACPQGDADIEAFNGRLREECLNVHWFENLTDARTKLQVWKLDLDLNWGEGHHYDLLISTRLAR